MRLFQYFRYDKLCSNSVDNPLSDYIRYGPLAEHGFNANAVDVNLPRYCVRIC